MTKFVYCTLDYSKDESLFYKFFDNLQESEKKSYRGFDYNLKNSVSMLQTMFLKERLDGSLVSKIYSRDF